MKKKKILILALHMSYGGVENAISNMASMLVKKYDVEIVSLYKKGEIPFNIDKNVRVTYLLNTTSNREEFLNNLKKLRIFKTLKEGFKSVYILFNKNRLIKKTIVNSDANVIISTRISFSKILNKWGRKDTIKIHQEHTYSVSDSYINDLNRLNNIDYILTVSKKLYDEYNGKVNDNLAYIPLALNYYPKDSEVSKLDNDNLIYVGRLEPEKSPLELVEIMKELVSKNDKIKLNIFGDGSLKRDLIDKIKEYKLENNIKVWGFKSPTEIGNVMQESSLFLLVSLEESFGLVVVEAMSYGVPVIIYSSAEGAKELLNKEYSYVIDKRNRNEYVKTVLDYLNLSVKEKRKMGNMARKKSKEFSKESVEKEWINFVDDIFKGE